MPSCCSSSSKKATYVGAVLRECDVSLCTLGCVVVRVLDIEPGLVVRISEKVVRRIQREIDATHEFLDVINAH